MQNKRLIWLIGGVGIFLLACPGRAEEARRVTCTVKVVDSNAIPVADAEVAVYENIYDFDSGEEYPRLLGKIEKTDAKGECVVNGYITKQYQVFIVARKQGLAIGWDNLPYRDTAKPSVKIILERPCMLVGKVVDERGNGVGEAKVRAVGKTSYLERLEQREVYAPEEWFTTETDSRGDFSFNNFAADVSSDFWVEAPGWISVYKYTTNYLSRYGFEVGRPDIRLVLPAEVRISGRVIDTVGNGVGGVSLLIRPDIGRDHINRYFPYSVVSGKDGRFGFKGVPAIKHRIKMIGHENKKAKWVGKEVKVVATAGQNKEDVVIEVSKGGLVEVIVCEAATNQPINGVSATFWQEPEQSGRGGFYKDAKTDANGRLRVRAPLGKCNISIHRISGYLSRSGEEVTVAEGQTARLEIGLKRNPSVCGVVVDESGRPVAGMVVKVHPFGDEVCTDADGKFEAGFEDREGQMCVFARDIKRNLAVAVELQDESKPIKITLKPALSVAGEVTNADGVGIPAARFSLRLSISNCLSELGTEVLADAQGRYEIKAVPPKQEQFNYRYCVNAAGYGPVDYKRVSIAGEPGTAVELEKIILQAADQSITGVVVDADGKPAVAVPIYLHGSGQPGRGTATDGEGKFSISRICKGPLRLQAGFDSDPKGAGFLKAEGGDKDVKIILRQRLVHSRSISLVGKALPRLEEFKVKVDSNQIKGEAIIICFFDIGQRPSRHCVRELAKKAEQLKEKGVTIVAVQASKIDKGKLDKWVEENNISFAVGMIGDEEEKTRFKWRVKRLPWLILTDKEHIVRAEGFGLGEVDEKVK